MTKNVQQMDSLYTLQKRDIQEETFLPSTKGRSDCFEDPVISLLPNIPARMYCFVFVDYI
jgi:hypothetical protein